MKRLLWLTLLPTLAFAGSRDDYARQWPLALQDADAGAYRVTLDRAIYRNTALSSLRDIEVFNGDGLPVPAALFAPDQPLAQDARRIDLPWFPLPVGEGAQARDIAVISERDADGRVRRVETQVSDAAPTSARPANAWLIDASSEREPIVALLLDWPPTESALDIAYRVEGSDDLRDWRTLQPRVQLLDLVRDGRRLQQRRIALDGNSKYLRLSPLRADATLPLAGVRAELATPAVMRDWQWESLQGRAVVEQGRTHYDFVLDGRFPIVRADVAMDGNDVNEWTLHSRDADDAPWRTRAGPWVAFQVGGEGGGDRSTAQVLGEVVRDRHWRLSSRAPATGVPTLRLGYRPEVVVFLAQGKPPYALTAGSARATRIDAPLPQLVDTIRAQRGGDWQPAWATLGVVQMLAGPQALIPASPERDWKAWLLWSLLVLGALVVASFAFSLLRKPPVARDRQH